jgi:glycosyltransferase involved in cell wall biosynthesis
VLDSRWSVDGVTHRHQFLLGGRPAELGDIVDPTSREVFDAVLDLFDFDAVHVHNLIGHSLAPLDALRSFPGTVVCTVHDYFLACPHHWLLYRNQVACGIPDDLELCATCLPETRQLPVETLVDFRAAVRDRLSVVDHWIFPSRSAADQIGDVYDIDPARVHVLPHGIVTAVAEARDVDERHVLDDPLRIAFVGRGWAKKGLAVANWLADDVATTPIEVHHFGEAKEAASEHLIEHDAYDNRELPRLLIEHGIHVVWLPGPYAETFGLVMAEALSAGLPVIGPPYGAIGERIREDQVGWTVDPGDLTSVRDLIDALDGGRFELLRATRRAATASLHTVVETAPAYTALYGSRRGEDTHMRAPA